MFIVWCFLRSEKELAAIQHYNGKRAFLSNGQSPEDFRVQKGKDFCGE